MTIKVVAEIGINHNGDVGLAEQMIQLAAVSGCDYVKFQKRCPDVCVPKDQKTVKRETPWGEMSYLDYKKRLEFDLEAYTYLKKVVSKIDGIEMFSSVWDIPSVDFTAKHDTLMKIPSALITNLELCQYARDNCDTLIISTGMSTEQEIEACVEACEPEVIMHTNSSYPASVDELNLNYITHLKLKWPNTEIGYSGHEYGLTPTFAAAALGATWVERHITLDRMMWGSDQTASVEPIGFMKLVKGIRDIEMALGTDSPRVVYPSELSKRKSLRGLK